MWPYRVGVRPYRAPRRINDGSWASQSGQQPMNGGGADVFLTRNNQPPRQGPSGPVQGQFRNRSFSRNNNQHEEVIEVLNRFGVLGGDVQCP